MTTSESGRAPALINFLAGYPGPAETEYGGGAVDVVAALIYKDGVRIDWRMRSMPDLSWLPSHHNPVGLTQQLDLPSSRSDFRRVTGFWNQGRLFDHQGNEFPARVLERHEHQGGWQGELAFFRPEQRADMRELTLRVGDLTMVIPLAQTPHASPAASRALWRAIRGRDQQCPSMAVPSRLSPPSCTPMKS